MAKETEEEKREERKMMGCGCSFWVKLLNMCLGALMMFYSIFSFFEVHLNNNAVIIYMFKSYEV